MCFKHVGGVKSNGEKKWAPLYFADFHLLRAGVDRNASAVCPVGLHGIPESDDMHRLGYVCKHDVKCGLLRHGFTVVSMCCGCDDMLR